MSIVESELRPSKHITPVNRESDFAIRELFFSTTDNKGIITSGNEVFARVSKYELADMIGKPHNIIRHPDTPRVVFKYLWDYVQAGKPIAAYVKNIASDGTYYWVLAAIVPINGGYLSVRLKPSSPLFRSAERMYKELRAIEVDIEDRPGKRRSDGIEASEARPTELLNKAGFANYDAFMRKALSQELMGREKALANGGDLGADNHRYGYEPRLSAILDACGRTNKFLAAFVGDIAGYANLSTELQQKSTSIEQLAEDIRLFALNALLQCGRMTGSDGIVLGSVAEQLRDTSLRVGSVTDALRRKIDSVVNLLEELEFRIAINKLQNEGAVIYVRELLTRGEFDPSDLRILTPMQQSLVEGSDHLFSSLESFESDLASLIDDIKRLTSDLRVMRALERNGRIEAARIEGASSFSALFEAIGAQVAGAQDDLGSFLLTSSTLKTQDSGVADQMRAELRRFEQNLTYA